MRKAFKWVIHKAANRAGFTLIRNTPPNPQREKQLTFKHFLSLYFSHIPQDFFLVQIGANDGRRGDPLHDFIKQFNPKGILVEPIDHEFASLQEIYRGDAVVLAKVAIAHTPQMLYVAQAPNGVHNASFNKNVLRKWLRAKFPANTVNEDRLNEVIKEVSVKTYSFNEFTNVYHIKKIDLLQIDCEGYDYEIIKMINFERFSPTLINFESSHFNDTDRAECESLLESKGYQLFRHGPDTCAFRI